MNLIHYEPFVAASGATLPWKIECDALTGDDWIAIAQIAKDIMPLFGIAVGVPRGGDYLASLLNQGAFPSGGPVLFVDDVWTTGGSMRRTGLTDDDLGFVVFARGDLPPNVTALFHVRSREESK